MSRTVRLSRRLVLEEPRRQPDGLGGHALIWQPLGGLWAEITPRSSREDFVGAQVRPRVLHRIIIRTAPLGNPSRPRPDQRFREGTRIFDILTVTEHGTDGRYLEILAEEGVVS